MALMMDDGARPPGSGRGVPRTAPRGSVPAHARPPPAGASLDLALELPQAILDHDLGEVRDDFPRDVAHHLVADQLDDPARDAIDVLVAQSAGGAAGGRLRGGLAVARGGDSLLVLTGVDGRAGGAARWGTADRGLPSERHSCPLLDRRGFVGGPGARGRGGEPWHGLRLRWPLRLRAGGPGGRP